MRGRGRGRGRVRDARARARCAMRVRDARARCAMRGVTEGPRQKGDGSIRVGTLRHTQRGVSNGKREGGPGTLDALLARMPRLTLVLGLGAMAALLTAAACSSARSNQGAADGSSMTPAAPCPANVPCGCTCPTVDEDGGVCVCASFSMPACPTSVQADTSCHSSGSYMNCLGGVAGIECSCSDAGLWGADGGAGWDCIGTGQQCSGGTFSG